jgi:hypothetical protein
MTGLPSIFPSVTKPSGEWQMVQHPPPFNLDTDEALPALVEPTASAEITRLKELVAHLQLQIEHYKKEEQKRDTETYRLKRISKIIEDNVKCPLCRGTSLLPLVLGTCGHHLCERCLAQYDIVSQRRVCPTCRADIVGHGFPMISLNNIIAALIEGDFIDSEDTLLANGFRKGAPMAYPKRTAPHMHSEGLRIAQWAQTRLGTFAAVHAVSCAKEMAFSDPFQSGVLFDFEPSTSLQFVDVVARLCINRYGMSVGRVKNRPTLTVQYKSAADDQVPFRACQAVCLRADGHVLPIPVDSILQLDPHPVPPMARYDKKDDRVMLRIAKDTKEKKETLMVCHANGLSIVKYAKFSFQHATHIPINRDPAPSLSFLFVSIYSPRFVILWGQNRIMCIKKG